ncbi:MAG: esterase/lipase/thioesterase family protein, partial [Gemmatimonadetes bacterium]|nr:esterase/lipase/thioesterase family protein [Gemmatimonadota bacterium]
LDADAFVLESVYPTIRQAVEDRLGVWLGPLGVLHHVGANLLFFAVGGEIGVHEDELRPIDRIDRTHAPVLVIAGTRDRYTPIAETRALFASAEEPKELWEIEGAAHEDLYDFAPAEYEWRVGEFLARSLTAAAAVRRAAP